MVSPVEMECPRSRLGLPLIRTADSVDNVPRRGGYLLGNGVPVDRSRGIGVPIYRTVVSTKSAMVWILYSLLA
jgi:hypothetical protein